MLDIRLNNSLKVLDKKFAGCVLLASYKKPIKELLITSKGTNYIVKFSYKDVYSILKYDSDFIQKNLITDIVNVIQADIEKLLGLAKMATTC